MSKEKGSVFGATLLIAGTSIGAGMLAMPVVTASSGFFPSIVLNFLCWLFMYLTGLLFLEVTLWMKDGANLLSMAERFLGMGGKLFGGVCFIFLYGCLLVAYLSAGSNAITTLLNYAGYSSVSYLGTLTILTFLVASIIYFGDRYIDRANSLLMGGLIISFLCLIFLGIPHLDSNLLAHQNWSMIAFATPTLFSVYGYHNILPSVTNYLKRDVAKLRKALLWGTLAPFLIYSCWQLIALGVLSREVLSISQDEGMSVIYAFHLETGLKFIRYLGVFFSLFAVMTSLLGVAYSVVDFFADGMKKDRHGPIRKYLCLLAFLPPAIFASQNPGVFIKSMEYAGGYGEAILNGLFPIAMVFVGRYMMGLKSPFEKPLSKRSLLILTLVTFSIIILEYLQG